MKKQLSWAAVALASLSGALALGQAHSWGIADETAYGVTRDPSAIDVESARFLFRRNGERLWIEKLYVVQNGTDPPRTFYDAEGTFRFQIPSSAYDTVRVTVSNSSGTSIPQVLSTLPDGPGYSIDTAFRPGTTDVVISYQVHYGPQGYVLREQSYYRLPKVVLLIEPSDILVQGVGWENPSPSSPGRFRVLRRSALPAGSLIEIGLASPGRQLAAAEDAASSAPAAAHGQVIRLSDERTTGEWILVLMMGGALTIGLLASLKSS